MQNFSRSRWAYATAWRQAADCTAPLTHGQCSIRTQCLCAPQAGDWENGSKLLRHLTDLGVDPVSYPAVAKALCKLARQHVATTFQGLYPDGLRGQCVLARRVRMPCTHAPTWAAATSEVPVYAHLQSGMHLLSLACTESTCHQAAGKRLKVQCRMEAAL